MEDRNITEYRYNGYYTGKERKPPVKSGQLRSRSNSLQDGFNGVDQHRGSQEAIPVQGLHQEHPAQNIPSRSSSNTHLEEINGVDQKKGSHVAIPKQDLGHRKRYRTPALHNVYVVSCEQHKSVRPKEKKKVRNMTTPVPKVPQVPPEPQVPEVPQDQGHHRGPSAESIPSGSSSNTMQQEFSGVDLQKGHHVAIPMQNLIHQQQQYVFVVPYEQQSSFRPTEQDMVRDMTTPMPEDQEDDGPVIQPPIGLTIFKRIISAILIILDICFIWMQFASSEDTPSLLSNLEKAKDVQKKKSFELVECDEGDTYTVVSGLFSGIGTVYALLRIADMIGETLLEYQKQYPSDKKPRIRGFQILHGWIETVFAMLCDDFPQMILLFILGVKCTPDVTEIVKMALWMIFKEAKNQFRAATCKHIYKPCCRRQKCCDDCECCNDSCKCCEYEWDCFFCCRILYFRPCTANKPCCETEKYEICPDLSCLRQGMCCGEFLKDPDWAKRLFEKELEFYNLIFVLFIIVSIVKKVFPIKF